MAKTVKIKTIRVPTLKLSDEDIATFEDDVKDIVKNKIDDGYELTSTAGGDNLIVFIFTKTT